MFFFILISVNANATTVYFSGQLDVINEDSGGGVYSGTPIGTDFFGFIDDVNAGGQISNGTTITSFGVNIAAGGLTVSNDLVLRPDDIALLNELAGYTMFSSGDLIDVIDIEGDSNTLGGGRIEVGLSYIFNPDTFSNDNLSNYPFDSNDVQMGLFFIYEEDLNGLDVYDVVGQLDANPVPVPGAIFLFGTGIAGLFGIRIRKKKELETKK